MRKIINMMAYKLKYISEFDYMGILELMVCTFILASIVGYIGTIFMITDLTDKLSK